MAENVSGKSTYFYFFYPISQKSYTFNGLVHILLYI